ncbi:MAG: V-type ATP synthase subunit I [Lachnospiraceae bacterium]|jgi:V/A-type H+-transporting ATPase subunit I|nr:V-type ATP synthase subunit I [Lachnospiraceae bacterium]
MSVLPMERVLICGLKKDRKAILELLQHQGVIEIRNTVEEDEVFGRQDKVAASTTFRRNTTLADQALAVLNEHAPEGGGLLAGLDGRRELSAEEYETRVTKRDAAVKAAQEILSLEKEWSETKAEIPRTESQRVALEPWLSYDLPLDFGGTTATCAFTGTVPGQLGLPEAEALLAQYAPDAQDVDINVISSSPEQTCLFVIAGRKHEQQVREALRRMNFAKPPIVSAEPRKAAQELDSRIAELKEQEKQLDGKIREDVKYRDDLRFASDYFSMRADKYDVLSSLAQTRMVFLVGGFVPQENVGQLENMLTSRYDVVFETEEPDPSEEEIPVKLKNNAFSAPLEGVIESYSLPHWGEMDPSMLVAVFYYVLYGMMLSDAAYGLIMVVACAVALKKHPGMEEGLRKSLKMFLYCGIATMFWGFMFGSFFGDAVNVIASTFFGRPDIKLPPIWFEPVGKPMKMLVFCFAVGIVHLFTGLGAKCYMDIKAHAIRDAIYDVVFWYMLVGGCILLLLSTSMMADMFSLTPLPQQVGSASAVIAVAGLIGIILTGGRESRSWVKRILKGLYAAYGISGYLSDILSYSRLLALGLATSVIATVFNKMAGMVASGVGAGVIGWILFILIFVIGHVLNMAINAMGAYVHTNRLTYVEFFGKFYEGGGKKFTPFMDNTKYFKIKEEN